MSAQAQTQTLDSQTQISQQDEDEEEIELQNLEAEVNQMAEKILQYRSTLPDQLKNTLSSILAAQRPAILTRLNDGSDPGPSSDPAAERQPSQAEENKENDEKLQLLKRKISSNTSAMPIVLKRMKECLSRIDKLGSLKGTIHPSFKRTRTS